MLPKSISIVKNAEGVDFRKSINGLAAIIESDTDLPLGSGALFLFTGSGKPI
ncbi:IS66 family insertion sequence element accessory protein TnpB [Vibrio parahaemolyticus]|uniref:IS66 family insertion sequence element accessory protein TnpB n=1 Tax=Vibrio parahaemolyticus TaxID=670 RepID=UPI0003FE04DB|nr:IS66 family insertion sequence element accessory protein TnpB [Vibrio parahaemolyticus]ELU8563686.1 IS66 family insertion sequence element accessory protein TnpB [Vibrio parahaemolyticus]MDS1788131.1 IS66 family insertion sequence element accessory protein TnpB [Vibrio parahaemolyticus]